MTRHSGVRMRCRYPFSRVYSFHPSSDLKHVIRLHGIRARDCLDRSTDRYPVGARCQRFDLTPIGVSHYLGRFLL